MVEGPPGAAALNPIVGAAVGGYVTAVRVRGDPEKQGGTAK